MKLEIRDLLDTDQTIAKMLFDGNIYPWEVLGRISGFIRELGQKLPCDVYEQRASDVWVAKDAYVASTACLNGPLIVDCGAQIRHGAFIRGSAIVGKHAIVGNSTELKNSILFDHVQVPHFNYVGDSILGASAHLGASVITSNVRCDKKKVIIHADEDIQTNLRKMGAIIGDRVEVGCGTVLNPGTILGRECTVYPMTCVSGIVPSGCIHKGTEKITFRRERC